MISAIGFDNNYVSFDPSLLTESEEVFTGQLDLPGPDITLIRSSIEEFRHMMTAGNGVIHSASAAVLLYQHLQDAKFHVRFEANDHFGVVQAFSVEPAASLELADMVSDLLLDLSAFQSGHSGGGFTVRRLTNSYTGDAMTLTVVFASYGAPAGDEHLPVMPPTTELVSQAGAADDEDEIELF